MEPQKSNAPKRHPLQFNTKPKEPQKPKVQKETVSIQPTKQINIIEKPNTEVISTTKQKIQQKTNNSNNLIQKATEEIKKVSANLVPSIKINNEVEDSLKKIVKKTQPIFETQDKKQQTKQQQIKTEVKNIESKAINTSKITQQINQSKEVKPQIKVKTNSQANKQLKLQAKQQQPKKSQKIKVQIGQKIQKGIDKHPITIQIKQSLQKGSGLFKYTIYNITGQDKHGTFQISRKQEQFSSLSAILHQRWPGCFIPAINQQTEIKNINQKEKHKRITLTNFLIGLSYSSHLYYREEVQLFLRSPDVNVIQMFEKMPPLKTRDVISRFKSSFGEEIQAVSSPENAIFIKNFIATLRKIINNLGFLSKKALALSEAYDNYVLNMAKFSKVQKAYEQFSLLEYSTINNQKMIVIKDNQNKIDRLQDLGKHNPFYKLYSYLNNEAADAQQFLEVIIASQLFVIKRDDFEKQIKELKVQIESLMLGHKSLKVIATRKSKEQIQAELQQKHKKLVQNKDTMVQMFNILEILLAKKQIELYKLFKRNSYKTIMMEWVQFSSQTTPEIQAIWQFIAVQAKQHFK